AGSRGEHRQAVAVRRQPGDHQARARLRRRLGSPKGWARRRVLSGLERLGGEKGIGKRGVVTRDMAVHSGVRHIRHVTQTFTSRGGNMRITWTITGVLALVAVAPLAAQQQQGKDKDPTKEVAAGVLPAGWASTMDHPTMTAKFEAMGPGFHVTSGGAGIYYRAADAQKDNYTVSANFRQAAKGQHAEAYGLFTGGRNLSDAAKQTYLYFEVRQDGMFYVAHRSGENVHKLVDWTASPAIHKIDDAT